MPPDAPHPRPLPAELSEDDKTLFEADACDYFNKHLSWCLMKWILAGRTHEAIEASDFSRFCREQTAEFLSEKRGDDAKSLLERREEILRRREIRTLPAILAELEQSDRIVELEGLLREAVR